MGVFLGVLGRHESVGEAFGLGRVIAIRGIGGSVSRGASVVYLELSITDIPACVVWY